jgi:hypothetical protein
MRWKPQYSMTEKQVKGLSIEMSNDVPSKEGTSSLQLGKLTIWHAVSRESAVEFAEGWREKVGSGGGQDRGHHPESRLPHH